MYMGAIPPYPLVYTSDLEESQKEDEEEREKDLVDATMR